MRQLFLLAFLLLPHLLLAQFGDLNDFKPGSYILQAKPTARLAGMLKLRGNDQLVVQGFRTKNLKLAPADVLTFRLGDRKYVTASDFEVNQGLIHLSVDRAFVEQLDSGQVVLLRYDYTVGGGPMMGAGGMMYGGTSASRSLYLLRKDGALLPIPANSFNGGQKFRDALLPHLIARPDLTKMVVDKRVTSEDMPDIIHALNTGKTFRAITVPAN